LKDVENWLALFGGMSGGTLAVLVILGAFALAGFAIYARAHPGKGATVMRMRGLGYGCPRDGSRMAACGDVQWTKSETSGSDKAAALMILAPIAHVADEDGLATCTYDRLTLATGLSRAKVANGLSVLADLGCNRAKAVRAKHHSAYELRQGP